jgi:iron complex outermembrane receptor protein
MTLEELMNVEITSVARKEQRLMQAPSAVYVINAEDLSRSESRMIPEILRRVPGVQVARVDANKWAVSARGFNARFSNKLQVLFDGRVVYDRLFSGVLWDMQDTYLPDVSRIEVIRGPGATVWGSNAVNGVVNVMTKSARETQGWDVTLGTGTEERGFAGARFGGQVDEELYYRVFAQAFNRDDSQFGFDDWWQARTGFRADWILSREDTLTFQGEYYQGSSGSRYTLAMPPPLFSSTFDDDFEVSGGHLIARWNHRWSAQSDLELQLTADRIEFETQPMGQVRDTVSLDFRHRFPLLESQDITWGAGYSLTADELESSFAVSFDPMSETEGLLHTFVQDEIELLVDLLKLTVGSKFEYNERTGFEYQPGVRLLWTPHESHAVWAAVSRAVRIPSRADDDVRFVRAVFPGPPVTRVVFLGDDDRVAEKVLAYEAGYRVQPVEALSLDLAVFYNVYDDLDTNEPGLPVPVLPDVEIPVRGANQMSGRSYGVEPAVWIRMAEGWTLHGSYTFLRINLIPDSDSLDPTAENAEGQSPRNQAHVRLSGQLGKGIDLDVVGRYVDVLPDPDVSSYVELDARVAWRPSRGVELSLTGTNLLHDDHREAGPSFLGEHSSRLERAVAFALRLVF